jgi:hypothetical protein
MTGHRNSPSQECGVIYVARGSDFVTEAEASTDSLRQQMPAVNITLFTEDRVTKPALFDRILSPPARSDFPLGDKIDAILASPYDRTVFLDSDTHVCEPFWDLFELMDRFEFAAVRQHRLDQAPESACPACFHEYNSGVLVYRQTQAVKQMLKKWRWMYWHRFATPKNQRALREALYLSKVRLYGLPETDNTHFEDAVLYGPGFRPVILHGRLREITGVRQLLKTGNNWRVMFPNFSTLAVSRIAIADRRHHCLAAPWLGALRIIGLLGMWLKALRRR